MGMIRISPEEAVTLVFFSNPRLKFLTLCCTIKSPFWFHLVGETFDFFSRLYYTSSSWGSRGLTLLSFAILTDLSDYLGSRLFIDNFFSKL